MKLYMESRCGKKNYWYSKLLAVFITTFLVFTIPLLIEVLLSSICFDMSSNGDPSNSEYLETVEWLNRYPLYKLYANHKILYAVLMIFIFGIVSGILASFNFAITTLPIFVFRIFTFFTLYILIYIISIIRKLYRFEYSINYYYILRMFDATVKNYPVYLIFLLVLAVISVGLIAFKTKKDDVL